MLLLLLWLVYLVSVHLSVRPKSPPLHLPPCHKIEINFTRRKFLIKNQQTDVNLAARRRHSATFACAPAPLQLPLSPFHHFPLCVCFLPFFFLFFFLVYIRLPFLFDVLCFFGQHLMPVTRVIPAGQEGGGGSALWQPVHIHTHIIRGNTHTLTCC